MGIYLFGFGMTLYGMSSITVGLLGLPRIAKAPILLDILTAGAVAGLFGVYAGLIMMLFGS